MEFRDGRFVIMNIFRAIGDFSHLLSFVFLFHQIWRQKSCAGISLKTQELYLIVFVFRYLDLFTNFVSVYNTCMKILFISATGTIVYLIRKREPWKNQYESDVASKDTFLHLQFGVLPCFVLACLPGFHFEFTLMEILWATSIYLEALAILPQLIVLQRHGVVENLKANYVVTLGMYRGFYLLNWIYRYYHEPYYRQWLVWLAGFAQTLLYADFFYYYFTSRDRDGKMKLPT